MAWASCTPPNPHLTGHGLAAVGVAATGCVALYAQTLVAAVGVDAALAAGECGAALVHVGARPAVILQAEAGAAAALRARGAWGGHGQGAGLPQGLQTCHPETEGPLWLPSPWVAGWHRKVEEADHMEACPSEEALSWPTPAIRLSPLPGHWCESPVTAMSLHPQLNAQARLM